MPPPAGQRLLAAFDQLTVVVFRDEERDYDYFGVGDEERATE